MSAIDGEKIEKQSEREHLWYDDHIKVESWHSFLNAFI